MAKEKKLKLTTPGTSDLPAVYATDVLKLGEIGAMVVYTVTKTTSQYTNGVKTTTTAVVRDAINIRFSTADSPVTEAVKRKLTSNIQALVDLYLGGGTDVATPTVIVGPVGYTWYYDKGMALAITKLLIGDVIVAEAHYMGAKPTATTQPSQIIYPATNGTVPPTLANIVNENLATIINRELYGAH